MHTIDTDYAQDRLTAAAAFRAYSRRADQTLGYGMALREVNLWRDTRGAAVVEFALVAPVLIALLLPIADIGIAEVSYINAYQSLRDVAAYVQYNPPPDLSSTNLQTYYSNQLPPNTSALACGDTQCTSTPAAPPPTSVFFKRIITLSPIVFDVGCRAGCTVSYLQPLN